VLSDRVDVVVTDGFTGNVVLKLIEGTALTLFREIREVLGASLRAKLAGALVGPSLRALRHRLNPDTVGGAVLLGVAGLCVIGHGASSPEAVENGLALAWRCARAGVVADVTARLSADEVPEQA